MSPRLFSLFVLLAASAAHAQDPAEVRLSGTSSLLGQGDTVGLVVGLRGGVPLASLTSPAAPVQAHVRGFASASGFRSGRDFYEDPGFPDLGYGLGYGRRTLAMAETGLGLRVGWVELAAGPSLRYRDESFVQSLRYDDDAGEYVVTVIGETRTDVGFVAELEVRVPLSEAVAMGVHTSLRRYDAGTQVAGLGVSASVGL